MSYEYPPDAPESAVHDAERIHELLVNRCGHDAADVLVTVDHGARFTVEFGHGVGRDDADADDRPAEVR